MMAALPHGPTWGCGTRSITGAEHCRPLPPAAASAASSSSHFRPLLAATFPSDAQRL